MALAMAAALVVIDCRTTWTVESVTSLNSTTANRAPG